MHSAAAVNSMMREEHRHLLWAFGCINNNVKGYLLLFLYSLDKLWDTKSVKFKHIAPSMHEKIIN